MWSRLGWAPAPFAQTRIVSGVGVPQLSAIFECAKAAREYKRADYCRWRYPQ